MAQSAQSCFASWSWDAMPPEPPASDLHDVKPAVVNAWILARCSYRARLDGVGKGVD